MKTHNTLLFVQTTDGQTSEVQGQPVIQPAETPATDTHTSEPAPALASPETPKEDKGWTSYIFIALIIVVFYMFLIRPQSKRAKEERKFREALKKGDKIVTSAGIHGKVLELDETTAIIETEGQGKLRIEKVAIVKNLPS
jgi:preprotein translocase subunit YajC